ncbi:MAG: phosphatase PAP2 family protein [Deltaproteobacteria bacterium]|nr:phosphatase PAP2 family protein [Deltaproteobacteria bacterium]
MNRTTKIILISFPIVVLFCVVGYFFFDLPIAEYCNSVFSNIKIRRVLKDISKLGIATFYLIFSAVIFLFFRFIRKRALWSNRGLFVFLSISLSGVLILIIKFIFGRYRPKMFFKEQLYGFEFFQLKGKITSLPSGHATTIVALMLSLYFISPKYRVIYFIIAFVVVISRVLVCHHYVTDVVVGSYVAVIATLCLKQFLDKRGIAIQE